MCFCTCIIYGSKESPEHGFLRDKLLKNFKDLKCYRSLINIFMCKNMLIINNNNKINVTYELFVYTTI